MRRSGQIIWLAALVALALALAACGRDEEEGGDGGADPGITDESIKLGGSYPFSGPASAYRSIAEGAKAHFEYVNANGGVDGRKIEFMTLDDAYEPPRAVENARRLIQQEEVFALFNTLGTPNNAAIWDYVNEQEVPHLFVATGASLWGADINGHPWTIGWQPDYVTESQVYADYLEKEKPDAKVAVLYQNDAFGEDLLNGFKEAIKGTNVKIVAEESYEVTDPTVSSQVAKLADSGADTFLNITTPKFSAQAIAAVAKLGVEAAPHPQQRRRLQGAGAPAGRSGERTGHRVDLVLHGSRGSAVGGRPGDEGVLDAAMKKYAPRANPDDPFHIFGWGAASTMVEALEGMKEPTRKALMDSVRNLDMEVPILLPGIEVKTGPDDGYPIEAMQIMRFEGENWKLQGDVIQAPH